MALSFSLSNGKSFQVTETVVILGTDADCDVCLSEFSHLAGKHVRVKKVLNRWMVESLGEWLIQVDDGILGGKGWLESGSTLMLSPEGPLLTFDLVAEMVQPAKPPAATPPPLPKSPPSVPATPSSKIPPPLPKAVPPPLPKSTTPPLPKVPSADDIMEMDGLANSGEGTRRPEPPPATRRKKVVKKVVRKKKHVRGIPLPPGMGDSEPAANEPPKRDSSKPASAPGMGPRCKNCQVALTPNGACPSCGKKFKLVKKKKPQ